MRQKDELKATTKCIQFVVFLPKIGEMESRLNIYE